MREPSPCRGFAGVRQTTTGCGSAHAIAGVLRGDARIGRVSSCGCVGAAVQKSHATTHGMKGTATYDSWCGAKGRCTNPDDKNYPRYGGRGIKVCQEWQESFENFLSDMGERPDGTTLDRIDVNGDYEPGNCRWATATQQARNRRRSVYVERNGKKAHLSEVAEEMGITYGAAFMRLKRGKLHDCHSV